MPFNFRDTDILSQLERDVIDRDHATMDRFLDDLRDTCCNLENQLDCSHCGEERHASCRGRLKSFAYDLLEINDDHYGHILEIMINRMHLEEESLRFHAYQHVHAYLMQDLKQLVRECSALNAQGLTDLAYRQLYTNFSWILEAHSLVFDDDFINSN